MESLDLDRGHDRFARPQWQPHLGQVVTHDLDRHTLDHFDVVPRRVLRRQQAETCAAAGLNAVDMPGKRLPMQRVNPDLGRLTGAHEANLVFFVAISAAYR